MVCDFFVNVIASNAYGFFVGWSMQYKRSSVCCAAPAELLSRLLDLSRFDLDIHLLHYVYPACT